MMFCGRCSFACGLLLLLSGSRPAPVNTAKRSPASFTLLTTFTTSPTWLATDVAQLGLQYGIGGWSAYSSLHGYSFRPVFVGPSGEPLNWARVYMTLSTCKELQMATRNDSWVVWVESDIWVTNYHKKLESILEHAQEAKIKPGAFIADIDAAGNLNTGFAMVQCSLEGMNLMEELLRLKEREKHNDVLHMWDHNGAVILAQRDPVYSPYITLIPPKLCNSYPLTQDEAVVSCSVSPEDTCDKGWWSPGDFVVHFAGMKHKMKAFLQAFPANTWTGYSEHLSANLVFNMNRDAWD